MKKIKESENMLEFACILETDFIEIHIALVIANDEEEAIEKFKQYVKERVNNRYIYDEDNIVCIDIDNIDILT